MALRCLKLMRSIGSANTFRQSLYTTLVTYHEPVKVGKPKEYRTENNVVYYEDPDKFGTLSRNINRDRVVLEDEGDIEEEKHLKDKPLANQKLTIKQYSDIIKQYLKYKRLKEALNVLEVRMLHEDKVKPENYIYNILIGACAEVGYTKKAFKLFNDMKKRGLKPTGDTYTCLFEACCNSPWLNDGLTKAKHLREHMIEKGIEPNLTNYNVMIKAFGRCGDLPTAFQIVDEMKEKKIKIRVHTFNHLLQACISDKENGLRHALIVWRIMLKMREKPNIYSFNLMLKCVKDCNMGSKDDILEMLSIIQEHIVLSGGQHKMLQIESKATSNEQTMNEPAENMRSLKEETLDLQQKVNKTIAYNKNEILLEKLNELTVTENVSMQLVERPKTVEKASRTVPNLLSKHLQMQEVLSLKEARTVQDRFAIVGGQEDFLKEMEEYSVKPIPKTFTQMVPLLEDTREAEHKLLDTIKRLDVKVDIDFYNTLIKKRCLRLDYDGAFEVKDLIEKENKRRKKLYPLKKKLQIEPNIMTYGVLAMACKTKKDAESLLNEMKEEHLKVNIEILGTLLRQGTATSNFGYILHIMNLVKIENLQINHVFLKHLEVFNEKCISIANKQNNDSTFKNAYRVFSMAYKNWLKDINIDEVLKPEHPWAQFNSTYPETVQRQNIEIKEPKKFYKRQRKFIRYAPPV